MDRKQVRKRKWQIIKLLIDNGLFVVAIKLYRQLAKFDASTNLHEIFDRLEREDALGEKMRKTIEELGVTYIKFGQMISTRVDLFSEDTIIELEKLQDHVESIPFEQVERILIEEMGELSKVFNSIDLEPVASGSIAQVHRAVMVDGTKIALKVQKPDIEENILLDTHILKQFAQFFEKRTRIGKNIRFREMMVEFERSLLRELDFRIEAKNIMEFAHNNQTNDVIIPRIDPSLTSKNILVMEYIEGIALKELSIQDGYDHKKINRLLVESYVYQIFRDGVFHGDPHPGNIKILPHSRIAFLDFGIISTLSKHMRMQLSKMVVGILYNKSRLVSDAIVDMNIMHSGFNMKAFEQDVDLLIAKYSHVPIEEINLSEVFQEMIHIIYEYSLLMPSEFTILYKAVMILEGIVYKLDPEVSFIVLAKPYAKKIAKQLVNPKEIFSNAAMSLYEYGSLFDESGYALRNFVRSWQDNNFKLDVKLDENDRQLLESKNVTYGLKWGILALSSTILFAALTITMEVTKTPFAGLSLLAKGGIVGSLVLGIFSGIRLLRNPKK